MRFPNLLQNPVRTFSSPGYLEVPTPVCPSPYLPFRLGSVRFPVGFRHSASEDIMSQKIQQRHALAVTNPVAVATVFMFVAVDCHRFHARSCGQVPAARLDLNAMINNNC